MVRSGSTVTLYTNGVPRGSFTNSSTVGYSTLGINRFGGGASGARYTSNLRITKSAVYTSAFTPQTTPLTNIANTAVLTYQNSTFIDNSSNAYTLTQTGTTVSSVQYPFNLFTYNDQGPAGNNWTPNNISQINNSTMDLMTDVPTLTSATAANYCTWNPLDRSVERDTAGLLTWSNGNLYASTPEGVDGTKGTMWLTPSQGGKYYFEITWSAGSNEVSCGIASEADTKSTGAGGNLAKGGAGLAPAIMSNGNLLYNNAATSGWAPSFTTNDIIGIAVNCDTGATYFSKNGSWINGSGGTTTFASAANASSSGLATLITPFGSMADNCAITLNCGQQPFVYTPPTGYVTLNTYNL
jgi:hypothetical protein